MDGSSAAAETQIVSPVKIHLTDVLFGDMSTPIDQLIIMGQRDKTELELIGIKYRKGCCSLVGTSPLNNSLALATAIV